ncbi:MAG: helix-turn-helix domain-containing protein [Gaiellaceae bacterium]
MTTQIDPLEGFGPTLSVEEAGQVLGISRSSAYSAARTGDIPALRVGARLLVPREKLRRMLVGEPEEAAA